MTPAEIVVALAEKIARESTDAREEVRRAAEKRLLAAFEALSGWSWVSYRQLRLVFGVMAVAAGAEEQREVAITHFVAREPELAGCEAETRAAIEGCASGTRVWPPMFELLRSAGLLGGMTKPEHLKRKFMEASTQMTDEDRAFFGR